MTNRHHLEKTLHEMDLKVAVMAPINGHSISVYPLRLGEVKGERVQSQLDELAGRLGIPAIRGAFIDGSSRYGLEVPNQERQALSAREIPRDSKTTKQFNLAMHIGMDIYGNWKTVDLATAPHMLIGGGTGSGKSTAVHGFICNLIKHKNANQVRFVMIDPKRVELNYYRNLEHLLCPPITDPQTAVAMLDALADHMDKRYALLEQETARDIASYNKRARAKLPYIIIIVDELADLMLASKGLCEKALVRLAQKARAVGIHLLLATQQPKSEIVTSLIKVNIPVRLAFAVGNHHESRAILDSGGAEQLLGQGDCLFYNRQGNLSRLQNPFMSEEDIRKSLNNRAFGSFRDTFMQQHGDDFNLEARLNTIRTASTRTSSTRTSKTTDSASKQVDQVDKDAQLFEDAKQLAITEGKLTTSTLVNSDLCSRAKAQRIMHQLRKAGVIGEHSPKLGYSPLLLDPEQETKNKP